MDKKEENENESREHNGLPIDRGWAWVILAASWVNCCVAIGSYRAFGLLFIEIQEKYGSSSSITSLITSILNASYSVTALLVTTVGLQYFSNRQFIVVGGVTLCVAYAIAATATSVQILIVLLGCLNGIAHGMIVPPTMALLSQYFNKYRSLANCIAVTGASTGALLFSVLIPYWIEQYAFSGTVLLLAGVMLQIAVSGSLMRPAVINSQTVTVPEAQVNGKDKKINGTPIVKRDKFENGTAKIKYKNGHLLPVQDNYINKSANSPLIGAKYSPQSLRIAAARNRRKRTISELSKGSLAQTMDNAISALSVSNIGRYASTEFSYSSMLDLSSNSNSKIDSVDKTERHKHACVNLKSACAKLSSIIDCGAVKRLPFLFFIPCGCFLVMVSSIQIYLPAYAKDMGISTRERSLLITIISITEMCASVLWGVLADKQYVRRHKMLSFAVVIVGVVTYFTPMFKSYTAFVSYSVVYGMFGRVYFSLYPVILVDFIGLDNLRSALGIVALTQTAINAALQPVIGVMRDEYKSYYPGMLMMATMLVCGGLLLLTLPLAEKCEKRREKQELEIHV